MDYLLEVQGRVDILGQQLEVAHTRWTGIIAQNTREWNALRIPRVTMAQSQIPGYPLPPRADWADIRQRIRDVITLLRRPYPTIHIDLYADEDGIDPWGALSEGPSGRPYYRGSQLVNLGEFVLAEHTTDSELASHYNSWAEVLPILRDQMDSDQEEAWAVLRLCVQRHQELHEKTQSQDFQLFATAKDHSDRFRTLHGLAIADARERSLHNWVPLPDDEALLERAGFSQTAFYSLGVEEKLEETLQDLQHGISLLLAEHTIAPMVYFERPQEEINRLIRAWRDLGARR